MVLICFFWLAFLVEDILEPLEALVGKRLNEKALHKTNVRLKDRWNLSQLKLTSLKLRAVVKKR